MLRLYLKLSHAVYKGNFQPIGVYNNKITISNKAPPSGVLHSIAPQSFVMITSAFSGKGLFTNYTVLTIKNYGDWKKRGPCRNNLHYLWKRALRIARKPCSCGETPQFLQPFSIDSAGAPLFPVPVVFMVKIFAVHLLPSR